ncbi:MAG: phosphoribosylformylglycinamidine synthase subunit PurS [Flavobacteriales bacterium]|nr:phosphoribosylformylglycinamidine synthase subunit PurS [Flavobacteriales bacterium]MCX7767606.1 phosphoribosylformylglycinamidine synthase subunit PurS [Flavobacteriales bacterium]MDW8409552.1 phosphoribosylformylglycinamidine synthase subunit PurS [Flavobacteriales bacterium]
MRFIADVTVMPLEQLLDPQGKAVEMGLAQIGIKDIKAVRVGKNIRIELEASNTEEAEQKVRQASEQLLCNPITEYFTYQIVSK